MGKGTPSRSAYAVGLTLGSASVGLTQFLYQALGVRALGEQFAPVAVLWTIQYLVFAILLYPVETMRSTALASTPAGARSEWLRITAYVGVATAAVTALCWPARATLFAGHSGLVLVVLASTLTYAGYVVIRGALARQRRPLAYAAVAAGESTLRLGIAGVLVWWGAATTATFGWTVFAGAAVVVLVSLPATLRSERHWASTMRAPWRFFGANALANANAQVLLAGAPLLLPLLGANAAVTSSAFVTLALLRAPLVVGYSGLLTQILPYLSGHAQRGSLAEVLRRYVLVTAAGAVVAGAAAALYGPAVVGGLFTPQLRPPPLFVAMAAAASVLALGNLVLNQVLIVQAQEERLVAPWLFGLGAAACMVVAVPDPLAAVGGAFLVGELIVAVLLLHATAPTQPTRLSTSGN